MKDAQELEQALRQFTGTESYFKNPLYPKMTYTDGVAFFIQNAGHGAYWLLDIVGTEIHHLFSKKEEFIVVILHVYPKACARFDARITADDGNGNTFWSRDLPFTDCPVGEWKFYLVNDVLLLPSEY